MSGQLQTCKCNKSTTDSLVSNQSKLLDKNLKPLVSRPPLIQAKLTINQPGDEYEQEADRVAEQVMRMPDLASVPQSPVNSRLEEPSIQSITRYPEKEIQRKEDDDEEEEGIVQMKRGSPSYSAASKNVQSIVHEVLSSPGVSLDQATRAFMEPRFGHDFSRVRVHSGPAAEQSAREVNSNAYTVGHNIVFGAGRFEPGTHEGRRLIAHELTHIVQQSLSNENDVSKSNDKRGRSPISSISTLGIAIQRDTPRQSAMEERNRFPWVGRVHGTYSAALRRWPYKDPKDPHAGTDADLPMGTLVEVLERKGGWLYVRVSVGSKEVKGYVSQELVKFIRLADPASEPIPSQFSPAGFTDEDIYKEFNEAESRMAKEESQAEAEKLLPGYNHCFLTKGTMQWKLEPSEPAEGKARMQRMQIKFTPKPSFANKTITFLQTLLEIEEGSSGSTMAVMDMLREGEFRPFHGMNWDQDKKKWVPAGVRPSERPLGYKYQPSSAADPAAYLYDQPWFFPTQGRVFESVAVVPETGETLGALTWGVGRVPKAFENVECNDKTSAYFNLAVEKFYAPRRPESQFGEENYNVILDGFITNDATLTSDQEKQLDPIVAMVKDKPPVQLVVGGFGDAMDRDPMGISEQRAQAVGSYLTSKGVPKAILDLRNYGATWARYELSTKESKEGRNRRVQLRLFY